jgi:hypothetical protein
MRITTGQRLRRAIYRFCIGQRIPNFYDSLKRRYIDV